MLIKNRWGFLWRGFLLPIIVGWGMLAPLSRLIPKRRGFVLFIGLPGVFSDNVKYLYLRSLREPGNAIPKFLAVSAAQYDLLTTHGLPVIRAGTLYGFWSQLRAHTVVVDNLQWRRLLRFHLLFCAHRIQLWHGCPLKRIEMGNDKLYGSKASWLLQKMYELSGRFSSVDLILSPSPMFTHVAFREAFRAHNTIEDDYPRNDVFYRDDPLFRLGMDESAVKKISAARANGLRVVLYMPTFRDGGGGSLSEQVIEPSSINKHALENGLVYVLKMHPVDAERLNHESHDRIIIYSAQCDIYPLLKDVDLLITDYSSVFFDYLHCDRPIVFFPYDLERYQSRDRSLYFSYQDVVPGPIVLDQSQLEVEVLKQLSEPDMKYVTARRNLLAESFANLDGDASIRIWNCVRDISLHGRRDAKDATTLCCSEKQ